jgi:hypothetical protein
VTGVPGGTAEERFDGWGEQLGELAGIERLQAGHRYAVPQETDPGDRRGDRLDMTAACRASPNASTTSSQRPGWLTMSRLVTMVTRNGRATALQGRRADR